MARNTSDDRNFSRMKAINRGDAEEKNIYANTTRNQTSQHTGSERVVRCYRSVSVCLVLLCVLLLTAVILLCVLIYTNNRQFNIKTKNITEEKDQLQTKYTNITKERDQLLTKYTNITEERDQLLTKYIKLKEEKKQLITKYTNVTEKRLDGWIYYQSSLYFISSEEKSWGESRRYCRERGADLIIINNKEEQDFVINMSTLGVWIGLSDIDEEGRWKWVDNSTLNYRSWGSGEPNSNGAEEDCVMFYSLGYKNKTKPHKRPKIKDLHRKIIHLQHTLLAIDCLEPEMSYGNIHNVLKNKRTDRQRIEMKCQNEGDYSTLNDFKPKRQQPLQSTGRGSTTIRKYRPATVCLVLLCVFLLTAVIVLCVLIITTINSLRMTLSEADGWIYYKSSLYFISSEKKSWSDSRRYCKEKAAELIIINNREEQDFIMNKYDKDGHWIGLSDNEVEGRWKWADGTALNFVFWKNGAPNGGTAESCAKSESSGWNDISCEILNKWICEKKILKYVVK
ncbi:uncharacterized protein [Paramisgurnus dabryanus]|uniref:uncharacterized protein n=1 Tax=Paramisgurnus dabryanus TaxID=90735 RepID=UPI003CCF9C0F